MSVALRPLPDERASVVRAPIVRAQIARVLAVAGLLGMAGCGSMSSAGKGEADSSLRLAAIFLNAGAPDAALRAADEALTRAPRNVAALAVRADALAAMDRGDEAQQAYLAVIAEDPKAVGPRIALGRMLVRGNPAAAEAMFTDVLARQPANAIALNNLGIARDLQGRHAEAQPAYRAARLADPRMSAASVNLGLSLVLAGDMAEAVQVLTPLAAAPDAPPTVLENLGVALAASGQPGEATRVLARVMTPEEISQTLAQNRAAARVAAAPAPVGAAPVRLPAARAVAPIAVTPITAAPITATPITAAPMAAAPVAVAAPAATVTSLAVSAVAQAPVAVSLPAAEMQASEVPMAAAMAVPMAAPGAAPGTAPRAEEPPVAAVPYAVPVAPGTPAVAARAQGGAYAQLGIAESEHEAPAEWQRLRRRLGGLLRDRETVTLAAEVAGRTVWRLRMPFDSAAEANSFCSEVRASGAQCWAVSGG